MTRFADERLPNASTTQPTLVLDGWPPLHCPIAPAGIHTWLALCALQRGGVDVQIAWPTPPGPAWEDLPGQVSQRPAQAALRLWWEQWGLPQTARALRAQGLYGAAGLPLLTRVPTLRAPLPLHAQPGQRLRLALAEGGRARAAVLPTEALPPPPPRGQESPPWPSDLPPLPEAFVLYHVPNPQQHLPLALEVWYRWAASGLGEASPLVLLGVESSQVTIPKGLEGTIVPYPSLPTRYLPQIYARAVALFHPAPATPAGSPLRLALAWGVPIAGLEEPTTEALVGDAAYLAPATDPRALGAALVTLVVEPAVAETLAQRGAARAAAWTDAKFLQAVTQALSNADH